MASAIVEHVVLAGDTVTSTFDVIYDEGGLTVGSAAPVRHAVRARFDRWPLARIMIYARAPLLQGKAGLVPLLKRAVSAKAVRP
jgi:hypothetical protein